MQHPEPAAFDPDAPRALAPPQESLADQAHRRLRGLILQRQLPAGTAVIEERLADHLGISRTPMREAILRLSAEGLLVKKGSRSFAVRQVTATEFFQAHKVRELLEPEAVELSMGAVPLEAITETRRRIALLGEAPAQEQAHWDVDDRLHLLFADGSGNAVLAGVIRDLRVTTRLFEVSGPLRRVRKDAEEHLAILDAFVEGDAKRARRAMARHLQNLVTDTMAVLTGS